VPPVNNDFSISDAPGFANVAAGMSTTTMVGTAVTSGSAQTVALSASGQPTGSTVSFNPQSLTAGQSATMTVTTSSSTLTGTYAITITGTGTSDTQATTFSLTVAPTGGALVQKETSASASLGGLFSTIPTF
jgi:hypothetical protein